MDVKVKLGKAIWNKIKYKPIVYQLAERYLEYKHKKEYERVKPKLKALKKYYKKCPFPELVDKSSWRQYRFILWDGTGKKVKDQIRKAKDLRRACVKYAPKAVYCTTSTWLDPVQIGKREEFQKAHYRKANNIMLGHDLIFDIDNEDLEESRKIALQLIDFMGKKGYKVKTIIFSGGKGFHVWFYPKEDVSITDPREREYYYMSHRREILAEVVNAGIKIDPVVTSNTRCIVRVPGTVHWKTGNVASYITKEQLQKPMKEILKDIPRAWPEGQFPREKGSGLKVWGQIAENPDYWKFFKGYSAYFISNYVPGTKDRYVMFLRYKFIWLSGVIRRLRALQKRYNLTDIYLFGSDINNDYVAVCLKPLQPRRLMKIVKNSDASNKELLYEKKFKPSYFRVSSKVSREEGTLAPALEYIRTIRADLGVNERDFVSGPHLELFKRLFLKKKIVKYPNLTGEGKLHAWIFDIAEGQMKEKIRHYGKVYKKFKFEKGENA